MCGGGSDGDAAEVEGGGGGLEVGLDAGALEIDVDGHLSEGGRDTEHAAVCAGLGGSKGDLGGAAGGGSEGASGGGTVSGYGVVWAGAEAELSGGGGAGVGDLDREGGAGAELDGTEVE